MKSIAVVTIVLVVIASSEGQIPECPEGLPAAVKEAFEACRPPKDSPQGPPACPPSKEEKLGCIIEKFQEKENAGLSKLVTDCPKSENPGWKRIGCIMRHARELCPDEDFPRKPQRGHRRGPGGPSDEHRPPSDGPCNGTGSPPDSPHEAT